MSGRAVTAWMVGRAALPNGITLAALASGMSAPAYAADGEISKAVVCVLIAAVLDSFDGRVARRLNCQSHFGAELDSLSDVICFGAAPAFILYHWGLKDFGFFGWLACLSVVMASAFRLARFNVGLAMPAKPATASMFFTGVPAPAGAFLALFPIFVANAGFLTPASSAVLAAFLVPTVALLMISTLPTFSGKTVEPFSSARWLVLGMLAAVLGLYGVLMLPWSTFAVAALAYFLSLPLSLWRHREIISRS